MVRAVLCSSSGGQIVSLQHLLSSLYVNGRTVRRLRVDCSPLSTGVLYGHLQRVTITDAAVIQFVLLKMSIVLLETCRGLQCNIYRVSQEEWTKLRESVPYVELYRYNPKHLYPKLNGYGDNGQRSLKL